MSKNPTFSMPPVDYSLNIPQLYDYHARHNPKHTFFTYADSTGAVNTIDMEQVSIAVLIAAKVVQNAISIPSRPVENGDRPVVAILASLDTITYATMTLGIMRAGCIPFPISSRNSESGVAHLFKVTGTKLSFASSDNAHQQLNHGASKQLYDSAPKIVNAPLFGDLYGAESNEQDTLPKIDWITRDFTCIILHSSGTTAFPKPIKLTQRFMVNNAMASRKTSVDYSRHVMSYHAVPMFHLMGAGVYSLTAISGMQISVFEPKSPPTAPTPQAVLTGAVATKSTIGFVPPFFLERWAEDPERVADLKSFHTVFFAGGPLKPRVGDFLVESGVNVGSLYGSTETGGVTILIPEKRFAVPWNWLKASPHCDIVFRPVADMDGLSKVCFKKCQTHFPAALNTVINGVEAYDSNDLAVLHPEDPSFFQIYGRFDEQIIHSTGENTNPIPIENLIVQDPNVASAIVFGHGKFNCGVLVAPKDVEHFGRLDSKTIAEFKNDIWPSVEKANSSSPSHSYISKEMIIIADTQKPFHYTAKGTPRRNMTLDQYSTNISGAYEQFESSSQESFVISRGFAYDEMLRSTRAIVHYAMRAQIGDNEDLFLNGCDSLQAVRIRAIIVQSLPNPDLARLISMSTVYSHSSISRLAYYLQQIISGTDRSQDEDSVSSMTDLLKKYTRNLLSQVAIGTKPPGTSETIVITGTTGALGSQILAQLLSSPEKRVYALNRPGSRAAMERQRAAFGKQGLDAGLLQSSALTLLDCDLSATKLGLSEDVYNNIAQGVTHIIHAAWGVNFNLSLQSMESLVAGTRNLVDLALSSRARTPRFVFISSVAVLRNWREIHGNNVAPESFVDDPAVAAGQGYGESKWVSEALMRHVRLHTELKPSVVRIGQICGSDSAVWNTSEWFPILVRSSQLMGNLPRIEGSAFWLPIDVAAKSVLDLRNSSDPVLHLKHPALAPLSTILESLSSKLNLPIVPYSEWLEKLEASNDVEKLNPGRRLLDFFRHLGSSDLAQAADGPPMEMYRALNGSLALRGLTESPIGRSEVEAWVRNWKRLGYLD